MRTAHRTPVALAVVAALLVSGVLVATALVTGALTPRATADEASLSAVVTTAAGRASGRPANGAVLRSNGARGPGYLIVDGGTDDAILSLVRHGRVVRSVYVRAGQTPKLTGVPDGTYQVFVTTGTAYDGATHRFANVISACRFDEPIDFTETARQYTWWRLSVDVVPGGTAQTQDVDPASVPA